MISPCRKCNEPDCRGCNIFTLIKALVQGKFDGWMDDNKHVHVPDTNVGEFAKDTDVPGNTVRIIDRGGIGLYNGQLVTNPNRLTHYDKIRAMSVDELADYLSGHDDTYFRYGMSWLDWLKSPVEMEAQDG